MSRLFVCFARDGSNNMVEGMCMFNDKKGAQSHLLRRPTPEPIHFSLPTVGRDDVEDEEEEEEEPDTARSVTCAAFLGFSVIILSSWIMIQHYLVVEISNHGNLPVQSCYMENTLLICDLAFPIVFFFIQIL